MSLHGLDAEPGKGRGRKAVVEQQAADKVGADAATKAAKAPKENKKRKPMARHRIQLIHLIISCSAKRRPHRDDRERRFVSGIEHYIGIYTA